MCFKVVNKCKAQLRNQTEIFTVLKSEIREMETDGKNWFMLLIRKDSFGISVTWSHITDFF